MSCSSSRATLSPALSDAFTSAEAWFNCSSVGAVPWAKASCVDTTVASWGACASAFTLSCASGVVAGACSIVSPAKAEKKGLLNL